MLGIFNKNTKYMELHKVGRHARYVAYTYFGLTSTESSVCQLVNKLFFMFD